MRKEGGSTIRCQKGSDVKREHSRPAGLKESEMWKEKEGPGGKRPVIGSSHLRVGGTTRKSREICITRLE